jgi:hypothetical protein
MLRELINVHAAKDRPEREGETVFLPTFGIYVPTGERDLVSIRSNGSTASAFGLLSSATSVRSAREGCGRRVAGQKPFS